MAKRGPQSELNDRNWDDEEEAEEAGVFKQATADMMQNRVIKKAKRRVAEEGGAKTTAFGGFGGFGGLVSKAAPQSSTMFGLGGKMSTDNKPFGGGFKASSATSDSSGFFSTGGAATSSVDSNIESATNKSDSSSSKDNSSYLHALKALNESVLAWIKQHVDKNPYIILTPIFKDYEKYLATLEPKKTSATNGSGSSSAFSSSTAFGNKNNASDTKTTSTFSSPVSKKSTDESDSGEGGKKGKDNDTEPTSKVQTFTFGSASAANGEGFKFSTAKATTTNSGFTFGKTASSSVSSGFSIGQNSSSSLSSSAATAATTTAAATGFSFGSSGTTSAASAPFGGTSGFSFGTLAAAKTASDQAAPGNSQGGGDDDEYVPPKPEVKEIREEGSLYSKRCKLFIQKEGNWVEKGVGNVHVKPLDDPKTQLLIRADTNLGNILLNINLTAALPTSRQGKNNVLLVCVPNPPLKEGSTDQTPIPMLIRVKTAEEADELLAKLKERKALL